MGNILISTFGKDSYFLSILSYCALPNIYTRNRFIWYGCQTWSLTLWESRL